MATGAGSRGVRAAIAVAIALAVLVAARAWAPKGDGLTRDTLPDALTDEQFWQLSVQLSEPNAFFQSNSGSTDNLLSNENTISTVAATLARRVPASGVYLGVGPEQNFTYIVAIKPRIAFITDIRRGNLHLHLLYKALFEMSSTRAEFVGRLFSRKVPDGVGPASTAADLMRAYLAAPPLDDAAFTSNLGAALDHLTRTRHFPLDADDRAGIEYVARSFYQYGPAIQYTSTSTNRMGMSSYAAIMAATDAVTRAERGYLASEDNFAIVKALERKNLIVPVVGDFAGPKAIRGIGAYLKSHNAVVTAFYVSNVEQYLIRNGVWPAFCANAATLPVNDQSVFIRPSVGRAGDITPMAPEVGACAR